jgi:hypothetical protein
VKWPTTVTKAGLLSGFHFHDLRHTGNQLAANAGATTRELMHRMGHGSMRAALIYQHATTDRDRQIAEAMGAVVDDTKVSESGNEQHGNEHHNKDGDAGAAGVLVPIA